MLPTISAPGNKFHHFNTRVKHAKKKTNDQPWGLLILLLVAVAIMLYTRHRSLESSEGSQEATGAVHRKTATSKRRLSAQTPKGAYDNLPDLAPLSQDELKGGWVLTKETYDKARNHPMARVLSEHEPRLVLFPGFLSKEETEGMVTLAKDHLERSHVVASNVSQTVNSARTSFGAWPPRTDLMKKVEERIHKLLGIPQEFGEGIYVLNYKEGQEYKAHNDNCASTHGVVLSDACQNFLKRAGGPGCGPGAGGVTCGDRLATFIVSLRSPEEGGRTVFPSAKITTDNMEGVQRSNKDPWYCNQEEVLGATPQPGDALLFWDYMPKDGKGPEVESVTGSLHSGCPVTKGEKWIATRWIRSAQFI